MEGLITFCGWMWFFCIILDHSVLERISMLIKNEIQSLQDLLDELRLSLEVSLNKSVSLFQEFSNIKQHEVLNREARILHMTKTVENQCVQMLLHLQPEEKDFRYIIMVFKVNQHLRRMSKYICNLAEHSNLISTYSPQIQTNLIEMVKKVHSLVERSFNILMDTDEMEAKNICSDDNKINSMRRYFKEMVIESATKEPWKTPEFLELIDLVRHLERLGDMAANVAEEIMVFSTIESAQATDSIAINH